MKTLDLASKSVTAAELLEMAREGSLLVKTVDGDSFVVTQADEFATEVELLRRNHAFLGLLDELKQDHETLSLDEVDRDLR